MVVLAVEEEEEEERFRLKSFLLPIQNYLSKYLVFQKLLHSQLFSNSRLRNSKCHLKPALLSRMMVLESILNKVQAMSFLSMVQNFG